MSPPLLQTDEAIMGALSPLTSPLAAAESRRRRWLVLLDPCGLACAAFTHVIAVTGALLVNVYIIVPRMGGVLTLLHFLGYNYTILMLLISHVRCACSNPGTARDYLDQDFVSVMRMEHLQAQGKASPAVGPRKSWCTRCDTYKPRRAHHCKTCRSCVLEMDHHCPWVNNCLGWRNHKYFLQFLAYSWVGLSWSAAALAYALVTPPEAAPVLLGDPLLELDSHSSAASWDLLGLDSCLAHWQTTVVEEFGHLHRSIAVQLWCIVLCVVFGVLFIFASVMVFDQWEFLAQGHGIVDKKQLAMMANSIEVGEEYEVKATLAIRAEEALESEELGVLRRGSVVRITDRGVELTRRVRVLAEDGSEGWISAASASGQKLLGKVCHEGMPASPTAASSTGFFGSATGQRLVTVMDSPPGLRWLLPFAPTANSGLYAPNDEGMSDFMRKIPRAPTENELSKRSPVGGGSAGLAPRDVGQGAAEEPNGCAAVRSPASAGHGKEGDARPRPRSLEEISAR